MTTSATNQHLNLSKTLLLHFGKLSPSLLQSTSDTLTVTTSTIALRVPFTNPSNPLQTP